MEPLSKSRRWQLVSVERRSHRPGVPRVRRLLRVMLPVKLHLASGSTAVAIIDFDLRFTYVLARWEGTTHDATILRDALERENGLRVLQGKIKLI
jgi:hypothetical protein